MRISSMVLGLVLALLSGCAPKMYNVTLHHEAPGLHNAYWITVENTVKNEMSLYWCRPPLTPEHGGQAQCQIVSVLPCTGECAVKTAPDAAVAPPEPETPPDPEEQRKAEEWRRSVMDGKSR